MNQFGVKKVRLKAIAKTPEIPKVSYDGGGLAFGQKKKRNFIPFDWLGAKLKALEGEVRRLGKIILFSVLSKKRFVIF